MSGRRGRGTLKLSSRVTQVLIVYRFRKDSSTLNMQVYTLAGSGQESWGDGQGTQSHFYKPHGVAVDGEGNVIVADAGNDRIRKIAAGLAPPRTLLFLAPCRRRRLWATWRRCSTARPWQM